jgi:hypothetical protein
MKDSNTGGQRQPERYRPGIAVRSATPNSRIGMPMLVSRGGFRLAAVE